MFYTHSKKFLYIFSSNFPLKSFRIIDQTSYIFIKVQFLSSLCENLTLVASMVYEQYTEKEGLPLHFHFSRFEHISLSDLITFWPLSSPLPPPSLPCFFVTQCLLWRIKTDDFFKIWGTYVLILPCISYTWLSFSG